MIKPLQRLTAILFAGIASFADIILLIVLSSATVPSVNAADSLLPSPVINQVADTGSLPGTVILNRNTAGDDAITGWGSIQHRVSEK